MAKKTITEADIKKVITKVLKEGNYLSDMNKAATSMGIHNPGDDYPEIPFDEIKQKSMELSSTLQEMKNYLLGKESEIEGEEDTPGVAHNAQMKMTWADPDEDWMYGEKKDFAKELDKIGWTISKLISSLNDLAEWCDDLKD